CARSAARASRKSPIRRCRSRASPAADSSLGTIVLARPLAGPLRRCHLTVAAAGDRMADNASPQMMPLRVTRNDKIADGIHLLEFRDPDGKELPAFTAGAHIALRTPKGLLRKYSLCNDPAERARYAVAVKREASGRGGSIDLLDNVKA